MYSVANSRRFLQEFLVPVTLAPLVGFGLVVLTLYFGTTMTAGLMCGLPFGVLLLTAVPDLYAKLKSLSSHLRWWHFLWLLLFLSGFSFRVQDLATVERSPLDLTAFYRMAMVGVVAFVLFCRLVTRSTSWGGSPFRGLIGLLSGFTLIALASTVWSVYPLWTLYKSTEYLVDVFLIAAIVVSVRTIQEFKTLFDWTWVLSGSLVGTVWLGLLVWPTESMLPTAGLISIQIQGVMPPVGANTIAEYGAFLSIIALTRLLFGSKPKRFYCALFFFGILTLVLAQKRAPLAGFFVALILVLFAAKRIGVIALSAMVVLVVMLLTGLGDVFWQFFQRGQTEAQFASFTGRLDLWRSTIKLFQEHPFLGAGAWAGIRFIVAEEKPYGTGIISGADNVFLQTLSEVGIIGTLPLVMSILGTWYFLFKLLTNAEGIRRQLLIEAIGVLGILSIGAFFTSGPFIWHPSLTFLVPLGYAEFLRRSDWSRSHETFARAQLLPAVRR